MNSKILPLIRSELKDYISDKEILDVILFGSCVKGKQIFEDIDVAFITEKEIKIKDPKFHVAVLSPKSFFVKPPTLINTLLREGYSLKHKKYFSEVYGFSSKVLFSYGLSSLKPSLKVKIVNALRGRKNEQGMVEENSGEWTANQVFMVPVGNENVFEKFFINFKVKYKKRYILMH